ncbi:MAG: AraC family transcriptional regulator [Herminiimonas sp.]|nr:AraC family transcriptional regulator [Herminiimonas sp.]
MHPRQFTLPAHYLLQIVDQISSMGAQVPHALKQGLAIEMAPGDSVQSLPFPVFRQLILEALSSTREPAFGLLIGERLRLHSHGILGYAAMNSGTIRQAVELFECYFKVRTTLLSPRHEIHGNELRFIFEEPYPLEDIRRPVMEAVILTIKNMFDYITIGVSHIDRVFFPFDRPEYAELAHELFQCEVRYGQSWAGFTLPLKVIDLPLKVADAAMFKDATLICQRELDKLTEQQSLGAQVKRLMLDKKNGFSSLNVTAKLCYLTPRTLHRRLQDEGTSYKKLLEEVRRTLAVAHLESELLSIQEISYLLGYTDMANFRRAFKRWESVSPSEYRTRSASRRATIMDRVAAD